MTSNFERAKNYYKNNPWKSRSLITAFIFILILSFIRIILSPAIIYGTTSWLTDQGIESSIDDIDFDIIDGTVSLINAKGSKDGDALFNIGRVDIYWHWTPLSDKTIAVTKVTLDRFQVNIEQYSNAMIIGGVEIPLTSAPADSSVEKAIDKPDEDKEIKPWAASLGEIVFSKLDICYLQHTSTRAATDKDSLYVDYCVDLEEMSWNGTISYATDKELLKSNDLAISSTGNFSLNGLTITDNKLNRKLLTSSSNTLEEVIISGLNNIHINKLTMNQLSALKRDDEKHSDTVRFNQLSINDIKLSNLNSLSIKNVTLDEPGLYLVKQKQTDWEHQQWMPPSDNSQPSADENSKPSSTPLTISLNNITINNPDLCYQDETSSFYYCFVSEDINWTGAINYHAQPAASGEINLTANGDFTLAQPNISNNTIDRNLLSLKSLKLDKLNVSGLDDIKLDRLIINDLRALQRSNKENDNTLAFDTLDIKDINYKINAVAVDSIKLSGLSNTVSKNKSGDWEHDKWQPKSNTETPVETTNEKKSDEPFKLSLNKILIETDKEITFIDNTTKPAMNVGLQKLSFDMSKLYSAKPKSDSPFKLYAKTKLHSTIDIKGTVKPFDDKVSFTANGDLKGFDLRVATPATKKAIGHIIQSGQLDVNLDLKAVNGELDSNIALSLYQFQMKSVSKEDAAKLDEMFGMPLNKTLVLLRDKDDSIHLDIPITGDVNNPDFNPMDAIIKATTKAATVSLITFYTPYGLLYAGGNLALNLATALDFDPIEFNPGSSEMQAASKAQIDKLSKLLTEKPQVRLTLCGITNKKDEYNLYPERKPKKDNDDKKAKDTPLTKEQALKLNKLASERQENSKNYLIKQHSIDHSRLILCEPEHKVDDDSISGVEINI